MNPKIFAFDLDGTLLDDQKRISSANIAALEEMVDCGAIIALASGRLGSSMKQFLPQLSMNVALLTLNGAAVYLDADKGNRCIYNASLDHLYSQFLMEHSIGKPFAINFYTQDNLYTVPSKLSQPWINLYTEQTRTPYVYLGSFRDFSGVSPSKIILVGGLTEIDEQEKIFRARWSSEEIYICRTWGHYLEFLDVRANKMYGLEALCAAYGFGMSEVVAFGDANNDIPMLRSAGLGIAMANSSQEVKRSAARVTQFSNNENGVACEWKRIKEELGW